MSLELLAEFWIFVAIAGAAGAVAAKRRRRPMSALLIAALGAGGLTLATNYVVAEEPPPVIIQTLPSTCWRDAPTDRILCTNPDGTISLCPELGPCEVLHDPFALPASRPSLGIAI